MKKLLTILSFLLVIAFNCNSQFFHETLNINNNLDQVLNKENKSKYSILSYTNFDNQNLKANVLNDIQIASRFKLFQKEGSLFNNIEIGINIRGFFTSKYSTYEIITKRDNITLSIDPIEGVRPYLIIPEIKIIPKFNLSIQDIQSLILGISFRYNYISDSYFYKKIYRFGYDFSLKINSNKLSIGYLYQKNKIAKRNCIENPSIVDNRVFIPNEFYDLNLISFALKEDITDYLFLKFYISGRRIMYNPPRNYYNGGYMPNTDILFGFVLKYNRIIINLEYTEDIQTDPISSSRNLILEGYKIYSLLLGKEFKTLCYKVGFSFHHIIIPFQGLNSITYTKEPFYSLLYFQLTYSIKS